MNSGLVSIADATLASPQHHHPDIFPAHQYIVSIADATLASPQLILRVNQALRKQVSIADATLASPQPVYLLSRSSQQKLFQSQTRRLLPRNLIGWLTSGGPQTVSIADATLASPQRCAWSLKRDESSGFNRRRDACFPATDYLIVEWSDGTEFQSQTRRLLPRNQALHPSVVSVPRFQSQTRRLLPRNLQAGLP